MVNARLNSRTHKDADNVVFKCKSVWTVFGVNGPLAPMKAVCARQARAKLVVFVVSGCVTTAASGASVRLKASANVGHSEIVVHADSDNANQIVPGGPAIMARAPFGANAGHAVGSFVVLMENGVSAKGGSPTAAVATSAVSMGIANDAEIRGVPRSVGLSPIQSEREEGIGPILTTERGSPLDTRARVSVIGAMSSSIGYSPLTLLIVF